MAMGWCIGIGRYSSLIMRFVSPFNLNLKVVLLITDSWPIDLRKRKRELHARIDMKPAMPPAAKSMAAPQVGMSKANPVFALGTSLVTLSSR
jgi:hypothetical protein